MADSDTRVERRDVLKGAGTAGLAGLTGLAGCLGGGGSGSDFPALGNYPVSGNSVTLGFNVPQSGAYADEGRGELNAYRLAKKHLNNGGGWVDMWSELSSGGILDKKVESVNGDTATDPKQAEEAASRMIKRDNAMMITGGVSSSVAIAQQKLCQQEKVNFMSCLTHSNATQGSECVRYGNREMMNAKMSAKALAPVLQEQFKDKYDSPIKFYQLYADYTWGKSVRNSMNEFLKKQGWEEVNAVPTPLGTSDFSSYLQDVPRDEVDVLLLDHFGADAANSVPDAFSANLDADMEIVVPLWDKISAESASDFIGGVLGTVDWNWQLEGEYSKAFTQTFNDEYGSKPSYAARLAYSAAMRYAAAVERAETFYPPKVIKQLEDYTYNNTGVGEAVSRKCDHQTMREVYVARGLPTSEQNNGRLLEVAGTTSRENAGYGCSDPPASKCSLGPYK